jgi:hypothetical protein
MGQQSACIIDSATVACSYELYGLNKANYKSKPRL